MTIERNESEDEFAFFAGGHADIVSTGSYETPVLEVETEVETVTIGKYNKAKDIVVVAADQRYATFDDLEQGCSRSESSHSADRRSSGSPWRRPPWAHLGRGSRGPADGDHRLRHRTGIGAHR